MPALPANAPHCTLHLEGLEQVFPVERCESSEGMSQLFLWSVDVVMEAHIDASAVVGRSARLTLRYPKISGEGERYIHGLVRGWEYRGTVGQSTQYRAELVPRLWLLSQNRKNRIFQDKSVPTIVEQVLHAEGLKRAQYRLALQYTYEPRPYCVQYQESSYQFLARLLEEEGIFFYFEFTKNEHVLVLGDTSATHTPIADSATVRFQDGYGFAALEETIQQFRYAEHICPGAVKVKDFNAQHPRLNVEGQYATAKGTPSEYVEFPGNVTSPEQAARRARVRAEALQVVSQMGTGASDCRRLKPGEIFTLTQHPHKALDRPYLITQVHHTVNQPAVLKAHASPEGTPTYTNIFQCIPATVPFRPPRVTPKPVIHGLQTAIVVGSSGEEIHTDADGVRVRVKFHWQGAEQDEEPQVSCWVRVGQPIAGAGYGAFYLPRVGHEVMVSFLNGGDPDHPVILGALYNGDNLSPSTSTTTTIFRSHSTKGGGGYSEIVIKDEKGQEELCIRAQQDEIVQILRDSIEVVGRDRHLTVIGDERKLVKGDIEETCEGDMKTKIGGTSSSTVEGDVQQQVRRKYAITAEEIHQKAAVNIVYEGPHITLKAGPNFIVLSPAGIAISGLPILLNSGGAPGIGSGCMPDTPRLPRTIEAEAPEDVSGEHTARPDAAMNTRIRMLREAARDGKAFCEPCAPQEPAQVPS